MADVRRRARNAARWLVDGTGEMEESA
jgi:hypothetical protein